MTPLPVNCMRSPNVILSPGDLLVSSFTWTIAPVPEPMNFSAQVFFSTSTLSILDQSLTAIGSLGP